VVVVDHALDVVAGVGAGVAVAVAVEVGVGEGIGEAVTLEKVHSSVLEIGLGWG
jgi:hypothetical protein